MTYSFPCQDLSLAGLGKGMQKGSGTRSGLLWEVERILEECEHLPQVLLMENVTQVRGADNVKDFNLWVKKLESLGYSNYIQDMIATDYCIPQTRDRTFMVSILGNYTYSFPTRMKLDIRLRNLLEKNVDEQYYLTDKMIEFFKKNEIKQKEKGNGFRFNVSDGNVIAKTITTRAGSRMDDNFIVCNNKRLENTLKNNIEKLEDNAVIDCYNNQIKNDGNMITITTRTDPSNCTFILEEKNDKKVNRICGLYDKDNKRRQAGSIYDIDGLCPTLDTCTGGNHEPIIMENLKKQYCNDLILNDKVKDMDIINHSYMNENDVKNNNICPTITTRPDTLGLVCNYRIRKLTPKECFRLMGVKDSDFENCKKNQSDASLYHLAGDSIVTSVLIGVFGELFDVDYKTKINELIEEIKEQWHTMKQ